MSHSDYYSATFEQLGFRIAAHIEEHEADTINKWEMARQIAFWVLSPNLKKGANVHSIARFEWEKLEVDWNEIGGFGHKLPKPKA